MNKSSRQNVVLAILIACEVAFFGATGNNFLSVGNLFECVRLGAELGLLALALTPVIVTGGIDLSVGSLMGLCAVTLGGLLQDAHWPVALAILATLAVSVVGGAVNASLISRLNVSPLIVTLGTYSLFRGLAEAITKGARSFSQFPSDFLFLGQGYVGGVVPSQMFVLVVAAAGFWLLLHRTVIGRGLYAVGHSAVAARYAAIPVRRRLALVYVISGLASGLAAVIYVAHLGQAKSDAGTGYELIAITAVVLGGASIFGGSGTIGGTLLGIAVTVVLQNGLRLAGWPSELAGILTGLLLILTIAVEQWMASTRAGSRGEGSWFRITRGAMLPIAIAALALVFGGLLFVRLAVRGDRSRERTGGTQAGRRITVGVMPKAKGDPYFISCRAGAEQAAKELNVDLIWDGPTGLDAARQNEIVEGWITRHVDAISVSVENAPAISTVLRKARAQGIKTVTWDADAEVNARNYFINQATPEAIGNTLIDEAARLTQNNGELAIITGSLSAANQNLWVGFMRARVKQKYPGIKLVAIRPSDDDRDKAFSETQTLLKVYPKLRAIVGISAPAVPGMGEAVKQSGRDDVKVLGLSLPNLCKPYVHGGSLQAVVLWDTSHLGYLAVAAPAALVRGTLTAGQTSLTVPRLGVLQIAGSEIILGAPVVFRKDNIDKFNF